MSDTIITVENLSKSYLVGHKLANRDHKRYTALRDVIGDQVRNIVRNAINPPFPDELTVLRAFGAIPV
jgi:lipopolysaccharide transport system ATP-binding protein